MRVMFTIATMIAAQALPTLVSAQSTTKQTDEDRVICRTQRLIGSLTSRQRTCMTRRAWRDLADNSRREQSEMAGRATQGCTVHNPDNPAGC